MHEISRSMSAVVVVTKLCSCSKPDDFDTHRLSLAVVQRRCRVSSDAVSFPRELTSAAMTHRTTMAVGKHAVMFPCFP